jgi:predicted metal-dependent HD superfamily phosphohydrolase
MIASNPDLLERELIKPQQMADGFSSALHQRGVDPHIAELAARVGIQVFRTAYRQWLAADDDADLAMTVETMMSILATIVPASASTTPLRSVRRKYGGIEYGEFPVNPTGK